MIGRNEICPCGSGKKYKKCCGAHEAVSITQVLDREIDELQKRLLHFALNHFEEEILEGFEDYQEVFSLEEDEEQLYEFVYTIWYSLFFALEDGTTILEKFIKAESGKIKRQKTKQILQSWINPRTIAGEITRVENNKLIVLDCLNLEEVETIVINTKRDLEAGAFFIGILLPYEHRYVFFPAPFDLEDMPVSVAGDLIKQRCLKSGYQSPQAFLTDFFMEIMKDITQIGGQVDIDTIEWQYPIYKEVAEIYQQNLQSLGERAPTVDLGIILWYQFCEKKQKRIKNPNLYAAGLHYLVSMIDHMEAPLTQKDIAKLYGVPVGSVSTAYREMDAELEEEIMRIIELSYEEGDTLDVQHSIVQTAHQKGPMPAELALQETLADLQGKDFESIEEANEYLNSKLKSSSPRQVPKTNIERAQQLIYDAMAEKGSYRAKLAHDALQLDANCVDAYVILAEYADTDEEAMVLAKQGMDAGKKELGKAFFKDNKGHFWGLIETRPFMRAKAAYADAVHQSGYPMVAIREYEELLELNPNDNQGIRYLLFAVYIEESLFLQASKLLKLYPEDTAYGVYSRLLLELKQNGFSQKAVQILKGAKEINAYVVPYLMGKKSIPMLLPESYQLGDEREAIIYADNTHHLWKDIDGLTQWLKRHK